MNFKNSLKKILPRCSCFLYLFVCWSIRFYIILSTNWKQWMRKQIGIHPLWLNIKEETRKDVRDKQSFLEWLWCLQQIIKSKVAWKPKTCWEWIGSFLLHPTCNLMSGNNSVTLMNISKFLNCVNFSCPHFHFVLFCFYFNIIFVYDNRSYNYFTTYT